MYGVSEPFNLERLLKPPLQIPAVPYAFAQQIFEKALKLPTVRDPELATLKMHYEGPHDALINEMFVKPPPWDPETWAYVKRDLMHLNTTKSSMRTLKTGVYGGGPIRRVKGTGPFTDQLAELVRLPVYHDAARQLLHDGALYGTGFATGSYDIDAREFQVSHTNPVTTHVITHKYAPTIPVAVCEFDTARDWCHIWTRSFEAFLAREKDEVWFQAFVDDAGGLVELPFFPVLIFAPERISGSCYGIPLMRDTVRFNRGLAKNYFNAIFASTMKAQSLLTIASEDANGELKADLKQLGVHTGLILGKGAAAQFINSGADVGSLFAGIDKLQGLEQYILGIPDVRVERNASAEVGKLAGMPLTSQIWDLARLMKGAETGLVHLEAGMAHWLVGSPATPSDLRRMYKPVIKIDPVASMLSLQERTDYYLKQAETGAKPIEDVVELLNPDMDPEEIAAQADIMKQVLFAKQTSGGTGAESARQPA